MTTTTFPLVDPSSEEIKIKTGKSLLWMGIISIVMLFAGLTSAYIVRQGEGKWVEFAIPGMFKLSTVLIILSSVSMQWAVKAIRKGNENALRIGLLITFFLGVGFALTQYLAWSELYQNGIVFTGRITDIKTTFTYIPTGKETLAEAANVGNVAGSFLYVITGLHVLHLVAGMIALLVVFAQSSNHKYSAQKHNGVNMCALYWHFLDGLWVYLFFFLLYIR